MNAVVECRDVTKRFGGVPALEGLSFAVPQGKVVGYLGPNGAGKSTTIRILVDLARPDEGEVRVLGADPRAAGPSLRERIGYLPGELRLDERLDVEETLRFWVRMRRNADERYVRQLCERLSLDPTRHTRGLSSGNRRKVGLVGAFMARPELVILDEPTSGVDPVVQVEILGLIQEARAEGRTVFLSSHVLSDVQRVADEVVMIRNGRVVAHDHVDALRNRARQEFTVIFRAEVPERALRKLSAVHELEVHGAEAHGVLEGDPNPLVQLLAQHPVRHVTLPELDLEKAFLGFYTEQSDES